MSAPRDELESIVRHLHHQVGVRQPGSAAEATAAAYINARLRRVGARVGTHAVAIPAHTQRTATAIFVAAVFAALAAPWLPLPGLLLAGWALAALVIDRFVTPLPKLGAQLESQNVFGTRAIAVEPHSSIREPRWRVLLLARLDTPTPMTGLRRLLAPTRFGTLAQLLGPTLAVAAALAALVAPPAAWILTIIAVAYLLLLIGASLLPAATPTQPEATPAAAILVSAVAQLGNLRRVELWGVALGAVERGEQNITTLLRNFPFDPATTLVIGIEELAGAQLAYATREGVLWSRPTDAELLRLADAADAADTTIDAEPRPLRSAAGIAAPLRKRRFRTITIFGVAGDTATPADGRRLAEQAVRLITGMVEQLDLESGEAGSG